MHRFRLFTLVFVLMTLAVGLWSKVGAAFFAKIPEVRNWKLVTGHAPSSRTPPTGSVLWSADMETGDLSQWGYPDVLGGPNAGGGVLDSGIATASVDAVSVAHGGVHAAKLIINTLHSPEVSTSGTRLFRWLEPEGHSELYYSVWYYLPQRYFPNGNPPWWNVFGWKSQRGGTSDPFFALNVANRPDGAMYLYLYNPFTKTSYSQSIKTIPEGQWFRLEAFYKCAGDNTGQVTFWQDGEQILDVPNVQTRYTNGKCVWSVNNYSSSLNPSTAAIYIDDAAICSGGRCP